MREKLRPHTYIVKSMDILGKLIVLSSVLAYGTLLVVFCINKTWDALYHCILVPGVSFLVVSVFRHLFNAPRPYESAGVEPLIPRDKKGKSFPSRHVFSIFIIAMTLLQFYPIIGIVFILLGIVLAALRVVIGVHFINDVIAGAALGILCGIFGYYLIF